MATKMRRATLLKRMASLKTAGDCCALAADLYGTDEKCEGTPAEAFIAGWVNAMDMRDENHPDVTTDDGFVHYCLFEVRNMGYMK